MSSFGGFTFTMLCDDVTPSRWEGAVEFLDSNALALGSYFRVPPDRFRYPVRSYKDIQLLPRAARVKLHEGVLFNMPLHVAGSWISGGSGVHWDSLESLRVAVGFLEAALRWCGGDMGEYIFPSTFLRRVGLKGDLFGEVRDGKGAPAGADIWPGVATGH